MNAICKATLDNAEADDDYIAPNGTDVLLLSEGSEISFLLPGEYHY